MATRLELLNSTSALLPSIPDGFYHGQTENLDAINDAIYRRNRPDIPLRPNMDIRSVPTRNVLYPTTDVRTLNKEIYAPYTTETHFAPTQGMGPPSGFRVNDETRLRSQHFALQHGADQGMYVPSMNSDLYKVDVASASNSSYAQPFPGLFEKQEYRTEPAPYDDRVGTDAFGNNTRVQITRTDM